MNDRRRGALIGLAVGDALGAAVEFKSPGSFAPVTGYRSGGPLGLKAGEWTDDTSMALALADSMASVGWDLNDQAGRYVSWWKTGKYSVNGRCFDIGITTRSALSRFVASKNALDSGDASERSPGGRRKRWRRGWPAGSTWPGVRRIGQPGPETPGWTTAHRSAGPNKQSR